ncbi:MAG: thioredoxin fold domain-containing protein [Gammaproteobacteria bacterium]|nr:thioredoxin fold domain-containing protein [Gammaproteobacteria bacterium]
MYEHKPGHPHVIDVNLADFEEKVIKHSHTTPVLVDFWADWCGPCHVLAPNLIKAVEEEQGRVQLVKVEVDEGENMKLAGRYNVRGFPTVILFIDGVNVDHFSSARPMHFIRDFIHSHIEHEHTD